ncbi:MAG: tRNA (adenosine(37)-N6)-threonylcarbamoyltransferase complex dimerization subunit type 1 TsaB [Bacteroidota bacterium]|nr:tRNA (adenosine(37)-N6)-threonylcarbamoyltransferase complex dimerization subunit type 1 TsaB [Bacteroidota bacterium]
MALILCLETATQVCSVALCKDGAVIALRESIEHNSHAALITVFVEEVMKESGYHLQDLDAIAVSKGPGSYTGLRIGVSTAKGFCFSLDKPLIAIETLEGAAVFQSLNNPSCNKEVLLAPMIDARRMEVYTALFDHTGQRITATSAEIIKPDYFDNYPGKQILLFGDGAGKFAELFQDNPAVTILSEHLFSATYLAPIAEERFKLKQFENLAYLEPFYFKQFIAGKPKVKGLYE